ncbi:uncharacterized protein LOC119018574 [Acanthopagrus latus]|uniref:uncharacterized protein LOC119018574 n=1 Tax=Acanthopagrus latus TaxID=8177 RepID=UPI00187CEF84|nr:uncharacterized protein LOC119018574 [Acanthopagrus latus]
MRFIRAAVALLGLLSVGQSAPVTSCESLTQTLDITKEQVLGKWIVAAESTSFQKAEDLKKEFLENYWLKVTAIDNSDAVAVITSVKAFGICFTAALKMTLENGTFQIVLPNVTRRHTDPSGSIPTMNFVKTGCSDCLLFRTKQLVLGRELSGLQLLSKRRSVTADELGDLKKQAECLNLLQPFRFNSESDLCTEPPSQDIENLDLPRVYLDGEYLDFGNFTRVNEIMTRNEGVKNFLAMIPKLQSRLS